MKNIIITDNHLQQEIYLVFGVDGFHKANKTYPALDAKEIVCKLTCNIDLNLFKKPTFSQVLEVNKVQQQEQIEISYLESEIARLKRVN